MTSERDLVGRAARGEEEALTALASSYRPVARRTALGLQASLSGFRGEAELGSWLHRVTLNLVYDHLRRARRRRCEVPLAEARSRPEPEAADPGRRVDAERARAALQPFPHRPGPRPPRAGESPPGGSPPRSRSWCPRP